MNNTGVISNFSRSRQLLSAETGLKVLREWPDAFGVRHHQDIENSILEVKGHIESGMYEEASVMVWQIIKRLNGLCAPVLAENALLKFSQLSGLCPDHEALPRIKKAVEEMRKAQQANDALQVCKKSRWIFAYCSNLLEEERGRRDAELGKTKDDKALRKRAKKKRNLANRARRAEENRRAAKGAA